MPTPSPALTRVLTLTVFTPYRENFVAPLLRLRFRIAVRIQTISFTGFDSGLHLHVVTPSWKSWSSMQCVAVSFMALAHRAGRYQCPRRL